MASYVFGLIALPALADPAISRPPAGTDPFYAKYLDAHGVAILGSARVTDQSMIIAHEIVSHMLAKRADVAATLARRKVSVAIFAPSEHYTDIPENHYLRGKLDANGNHFEARCAGGAIERVPVTTICERHFFDNDESSDPMVHEFAHSIQNLGLDPAIRAAVAAAYQHAKEQGLFARADGKGPTYLMNNEREFFAATSAMWFNVYASTKPFGSPYGTRALLASYDPELRRILASLYPDDDWRVPHAKKPAPPR